MHFALVVHACLTALGEVGNALLLVLVMGKPRHS